MQNTCTLCGHCFHLPTELERKFKENSRLSVGAAARQSRSSDRHNADRLIGISSAIGRILNAGNLMQANR
ncbi:hypothetical protein K4039_25795 [Lyngbya sp. CCAP 1446/10]|nr:hypothetical protein [Lyngbya sp. CCAP 1446/10]